MFSSGRKCFLIIYCAFFLLSDISLNAEASPKYKKYDGSYYSGSRIGTINYERNRLYNKCGPNIQITRVTDPQQTTLSPFYDEVYRSVFFTNSAGGSLYRYDIDKNNIFFTNLGTNDEHQGLVPLIGQPGKFLVNFDDLIGLVTWDGISPNSTLQIIQRPDPYQPWPSFLTSDATVLGPRKGLFFYSRPEISTSIADILQGQCSLYNIIEGKVKKLVDGLTFGNGFALIGEILYFNDVFAEVVYSATYKPGKNSLENIEVFLNYTEKQVPGAPHSIAVDADENLWITCGLRGKRIIKVDRSTKEIICSIELPAETAFGLTFAPNQKDGAFNTFYVTTSQSELNSTTIFDGAVLRVDGLPVQGILKAKADYNRIFPARVRLE